jgi:hypothetical protein
MLIPTSYICSIRTVAQPSPSILRLAQQVEDLSESSFTSNRIFVQASPNNTFKRGKVPLQSAGRLHPAV